MKLSIRNLAKIASADFEFRGITVIAGNNDTGKSTVGKALFALFSALSNLDTRMRDMRLKRIYHILRSYGGMRVWVYGEGEEFLLAAQKKVLQTLSAEDGARCLKEIEEVRALPDNQLQTAVISRHFADIFANQYFSLGHPNTPTELLLTVKGKGIRVCFSSEETEYHADIRLSHSAHYIEDPKILEQINGRVLSFESSSPFWPLRDVRECSLLQDLRHHLAKSRSSSDANAIEDVLTASRLQEVFECLNSVLPGRIVLDEQKQYVFRDNALKSNVALPNLSMGMKVFALLQLLLGSGTLQREDVLILDEPEVHLHPDWQLVYAEVVVLLQKHFDLTILLTSHSSDFIDALQLFAHRHGLDDRINAYISKDIERRDVFFQEVKGADWDDLYEKFLPALNRLRELRNS